MQHRHVGQVEDTEAGQTLQAGLVHRLDHVAGHAQLPHAADGGEGRNLVVAQVQTG